jgi:acyl transferase domain-containing protein/acyl carrier protein
MATVNEPLEARPDGADIAIVGLAALFPRARTVREYWDNILRKIDCITEVPPSHWRVDDYYDPDPSAPDKSYSKRGGFIPEIDFDPLEFGLPPNILELTDTAQLLALVVARDALEDAGLLDAPRAVRERTGVVLGVAGAQKLLHPLASRLQYPVWDRVLRELGVAAPERARIVEHLKASYIPWAENSFPGLLGNVVAGRICNRFDLSGTNCVVDAACASSLAALAVAASELTARRCDAVISGGVDTDNSILMYLCFSKTPAFTSSDSARPFDAASDGVLIGEGIGMYVLKRLADAERDNDRIYAVVRGIGCASDGRFRSIYAPRPEGQMLALQRAYASAGCSPATLGLVEAHGTGTVSGDVCEVTTLRDLLAASRAAADGADEPWVGLGSVKSQIGHTKAAAGAAGVIKAALALHQRVLPATINVSTPNPRLGLEGSPMYLNTETRPWLRRTDGQPRRAGVSAFGFGGADFHVVLEEHANDDAGDEFEYRLGSIPRALVLSAERPADLASACRRASRDLLGDNGNEVIAALARLGDGRPIPVDQARIGVVASDAAEAAAALESAADMLTREDRDALDDPRGTSYRRRGLDLDGRTVALFPGQGTQYVDMAREIACAFPPARQFVEKVDRLFARDGRAPLSSRLYPPPTHDQAQHRARSDALRRTDYAQPAIGAISAGLFAILRQAGFRPAFLAGHSFGELPALWAAGALADDDFVALAYARGRAMAPPTGDFDAGAMLAVAGDATAIVAVLDGRFADVHTANINSPRQTVLAGPRASVAAVADHLAARGFTVTHLPVAGAFHTPLVAHAQAPFASALAAVGWRPPSAPVYANATASPYPDEPAEIRRVLAEQILRPVRFSEMIEAIYARGGFCFVEFGPSGVVTNLVDQILGQRPHVAVALNPSRERDSVRQLVEATMRLRVAGMGLAHLDPHARPEPTARRHSRSLATVSLNGANYPGPSGRPAAEPATTEPSIPPADKPSTPPAEPSPRLEKEHGVTQVHRPLTEPTRDFPAYDLEAFAAQQSEVAHVHQQYLANQAEYARLFVDFARERANLAGSASLSPEASASLDHGMQLFHEHQAETSRVHGQYLEQQTTFVRSFLELLSGVPGGASAIRSTSPTTPAILPSAPVATSAAVAPVVPTSGEMPAPEPIAMRADEPVAPIAPSFGGNGAGIDRSPLESDAAVPATPEQIANVLIEVVSDKTGYPRETLELDMDIEADLGIDSIKRVEILGAIRSRLPWLRQPRPEELAELRTLDQIARSLGETSPAPPAPTSAADDLTARLNGRGTARVSAAPAGLARHRVRARPLPPPDALDAAYTPGSAWAITDDGTPMTTRVYRALHDRGFRVAVLSLPRSYVPTRASLPESAPRVVLDGLDDTSVGAAVAEVERLHGPLRGFVHLHPPLDGPVADDARDDRDRAILKALFLVARCLDSSLGRVAGPPRAAYMTVTHLDGRLGVAGTTDGPAVAGGLFGLTKTLRHEWVGTFCRALDLSPVLDIDAQVQAILAELDDPDRSLVEVGYDADGRWTLETTDAEWQTA